MFRNDYKVDWLTEADIAGVTEKLWKLFDTGGLALFPLRRALEECTKKPISKSGLLKIQFFQQGQNDAPARVVFNPLTLVVDDERWDLLKYSCPQSLWILAHEFGHIILHNGNAKAFSSDKIMRIKFAEEQYSAEWQADMFAFHLLMPDLIVNSFRTAYLICKYCGVETQIAERRLEIFNRRWKGRYPQ